MSDFSNITDHPDFQDIVSKIVVGDSPKSISTWLKTKYSTNDNKHLQISAKDIQDFADKHADLEAVIRRDIVAVQSSDGEGDLKISSAMLNNKTYRDRLLEIADKKIDVSNLVNELVYMCKVRMEQVFDRIQENPAMTKTDYVLLKYFEILINSVEKLDKINNNRPDQIIQHNISIQAIEQNTAYFQEAVRETLAEIDTEAALLFVDKLTQKMKLANADKMIENSIPVTVDAQLDEVRALHEMVLPKIK